MKKRKTIDMHDNLFIFFLFLGLKGSINFTQPYFMKQPILSLAAIEKVTGLRDGYKLKIIIMIIMILCITAIENPLGLPTLCEQCAPGGVCVIDSDSPEGRCQCFQGFRGELCNLGASVGRKEGNSKYIMVY